VTKSIVCWGDFFATVKATRTLNCSAIKSFKKLCKIKIMKKGIALAVVLGMLAVLAGGVFAEDISAADAQAKLPKLQAYISSLETKLAKERATAKPERVAQLQRIIAEQQARLSSLQAIAATPLPTTPPPPPPPTKVKAVVKKQAAKSMYEIGGNVGIVAGVFGVNGELTIQCPFVKNWIGLDNVWARLGGGYVAGKNSAATETKMVPIYIDGAIDLPVSWMWGIPSYVGGGLNYVVYRSGRTSGTIGGEVFAGIEGAYGGGKPYLEVGYGILRPSNGGSFKSVNAVVGYRYGL